MGEHAGDHESPEYASMYCLACDYVLDGLRSVACPECGCAFDPDDADSFRTGPVLLHDPVQLAQLPFERVPPLRSRLESRGIRSAMHEERAGVIAYAELPRCSVWVERTDIQSAREIMESLSTTQEPERSEAWTCSNCGEHIPGQFDMCWNCSAERMEQ